MDADSLMYEPLQIRLVSLSKITNEGLPELNRLTKGSTRLFVTSFIFHGLSIIPNSRFSTDPHLRPEQSAGKIQFNKVFETQGYSLASLPRESRLAFVVYGEAAGSSSPPFILGWAAFPLYDESNCFSTKSRQFRLWPYTPPVAEDVIEKKEDKQRRKTAGMENRPDRDPFTFIFRGTLEPNTGAWAPVLEVDFGERRVIQKPCPPVDVSPAGSDSKERMQLPRIAKTIQAEVHSLFMGDIMKIMKPSEMELVWNARSKLLECPEQLPMVISTRSSLFTRRRTLSHLHRRRNQKIMRLYFSSSLSSVLLISGSYDT